MEWNGINAEDQRSCKCSPDTWSCIYFNAFIHVYSPRADNPLGTNIDVNRKPLSLCPFVASFKTISTCFSCFSTCIYSPGQRQTTHWGQNFDDNRKAFSLYPYVASFKMISSKSDFIHIFNDFIHVYSLGARANNPLGTNFWCQQKALINLPICCKFKKRNLILYTFLMILCIYIAPGQGQTTPWGQLLMSTESPYHFAHLLQVLKNCFKVRFYIHFFHVSPYVYTPRQGFFCVYIWVP